MIRCLVSPRSLEPEIRQCSLFHARSRLGRFSTLSILGRCCRRLPLGQFLTVEIANNSRHVSARLVVRRHPAVLFHATRTGVVSSQRLDQIEIVALKQLAQITHPSLYF